MPFKRVWDASCPREYDRWEDGGVTWVIQDLPPEDDVKAVKLFVEHFLPDEALCIASGMTNDELSIRSMTDFWLACVAQRTSLACYAIKDDVRTLAAVNCCIVSSADDHDEICKIEGKAWTNVYEALHYAESRVNVYEFLGLDKVLYAMGLIVKREYRGARLGSRVLNARAPLALGMGVKATSTIFTGPASQKSAERAGFTTVAEVSFKELAAAGLNYPLEDKSIKLMVKKFVS
ncbi:uncharacterized protein LOC126382152 [Pectinophora gossypiella]|uniref:uncharacterized protein LOC126382152 n=1 Tax=Pectinophora gossypiella TaxID=13191 RepID=UPI00214E0874|nr:uncharacterized protein LOC126382152 [Pectinophora gossypiella]XP_049887882.1 uncharacterized protein LOC126382152 [Pectinophora gossypiella]